MSEELRNKIMQQTDQLSFKPRFGLFSQLISTAVGESNLYKPAKSHLDSDNKPITQPKNIMTSPNKSGQLNKSYFGPLNTLANFSVHDIYIDQGRRLVKEEKQVFEKGRIHQVPFIPLSGGKTLNYPAYSWMKTKTEPDDPKKHRNSQGGVITQPRGFYTNCKSNVEKRLNKFPQFMKDPYDNQQVLERQRKRINKSKEGQLSFKLGNYPPKLLNKNKQIYGSTVELPQKKQRSYSQNHVYKHQTVFKCSNPPKSGLKGFLSPFPQYIPNPPPLKTKSPIKNDQEKKAFKLMSTDKSQPCPSVTSNPTNMRKYISHSFNKRF